MKFHLEPIDWLLNPWHPHEPWPKPEPRAFKPKKAGKPAADTGRDEAIAMWNARLERDLDTPLEDFSYTLRFAEIASFETTMVMTLITKIYSVEHLADWIEAVPARPFNPTGYDASFRNSVLPYLTTAERQLLLDTVQRQVRDNGTPNNPGLIVSGLLGAPPEVEAYLDTLTNQCIPNAPRAALLGLPTASLRKHRETLTKCFYADQLLGCIAHTGLDYLANIIDYWLRPKCQPDKHSAEALTNAVQDPAAAPLLIPLLDLPKLAPSIRAWFERHNIEAAEALVNHPWKTNGTKARKLREAAMVLAETLRNRTASTPEKPLAGIHFGAFKKAPSWISPAALPPIQLREPVAAVLDEKSTQDLLALLAATEPLEVPPPVAELKRTATPQSLDRWSLELMETWRQGGMKPKDRWALAAVGVLGGPLATSRLSANLSAWAGGGRYDTARLGYRCLIKAGALWDVCEPALRGLSFASEAATAEAAQRNITVNELAESAMPFYGFDARGEREFHLGARILKLKAKLELRLFDEDGKILDTLPKPRKDEDSTAFKQAVADFRALKQDFERTVRREVKRFEFAARSQRKYRPDHFERYILPHPVMGAIARTLIWCSFDSDANPIAAFRIDETGGYAGIADEALTLGPNVAFLRILNLRDCKEDGAPQRWQAMLADYDIVQPFPQFALHHVGHADGSSHHPAATMLAEAGSEAGGAFTNWYESTIALCFSCQRLVREPLPLPQFEDQLERCLFRKISPHLAQRTLAGHTVKLHYFHHPTSGLAWLLQIEDPQNSVLPLHLVASDIQNILMEDCKQLRLFE